MIINPSVQSTQSILKPSLLQTTQPQEFSVLNFKQEQSTQQISQVKQNIGLQERENTQKNNNWIACCNSVDNKLNRSDIEVLKDLKTVSLIRFDIENQFHKSMLQELWQSLTKQQYQGIKSEEWKQFGFQSDTPWTDFRAAGLLSLQHLNTFVQKYNYTEDSIVKRMIKDLNFMMAVTSINITFFLQKFFGLTNEKILRKCELGNKDAVKSLCNCVKKDWESLSKIHDVLIINIFELKWQKCKLQYGDLALLHFNVCLNAMKEEFCEKMNKKVFSNIIQIEQLY